ncbi:NADPH-dependent F420 reductase [Streptomyces hoynatensis]|uniref:NADPH-dependent F420 reductase n=1 Tax=Streptomyces hoynatensis TaxID=1141874 RepID=UPI001F4EA320|nr:NAD(P)-binding domain-containing protein [Streptomyces hoynatensis]
MTIVGAGRMARGLATRALAGGHRVRLVDRSRAKAAELAEELRRRARNGAGEVCGSDAIAVEDADLVILAVPYPRGRDIAVDYGTALTGSVLVDVSNPSDSLGAPGPARPREEPGACAARTGSPGAPGPSGPSGPSGADVLPAGTSAAEQIAAEAPPGAPVVKAFNTNTADTLLTGRVAGRPLDVLIAGDEGDAKRSVAHLASSCGLRPLDVGPLCRARELEGLRLLHRAATERLGCGPFSAVTILS